MCVCIYIKCTPENLFKTQICSKSKLKYVVVKGPGLRFQGDPFPET